MVSKNNKKIIAPNFRLNIFTDTIKCHFNINHIMTHFITSEKYKYLFKKKKRRGSLSHPLPFLFFYFYTYITLIFLIFIVGDMCHNIIGVGMAFGNFH